MQQVFRLLEKIIESRIDGAHPRRVGHRQGADRARHPLQRAAREEGVRRAELLGLQRQPARERAVRPHQGLVHRRHQGQEGPVRDRRRRHLLPRRDRRHVAGAAGQAPARACRKAPSRRSAAPRRARSTCASSRRRTRICRRWSSAASSARTSTTASTSSRSQCRRCAIAWTTCPILIDHFLRKHFRARPARGACGRRAWRRGAGGDAALSVAGQHPRARERDRALHGARRRPRRAAARICCRSACATPPARRPARRSLCARTSNAGSLKDAVEQLERDLIHQGLIRTHWNKSQLAKELGISRSNLIMKVERYGLDKKTV